MEGVLTLVTIPWTRETTEWFNVNSPECKFGGYNGAENREPFQGSRLDAAV